MINCHGLEAGTGNTGEKPPGNLLSTKAQSDLELGKEKWAREHNGSGAAIYLFVSRRIYAWQVIIDKGAKRPGARQRGMG